MSSAALPHDPEPLPPLTPAYRRRITRNALGIGVATGAYALSFGAISVASGLNAAQTQTLSLLMFTGGSQFALVGVLGTGGGALAAVMTAWLLGGRNSLYALALAPTLNVRGFKRLGAAHMTIDESTAMALAHPDPPAAARRAFWHTGIAIFVLWNIGTLIGALAATAIGDPATLGLDAAIPAGFVALLWPRLVDRTMWAVALAGAAVALVLTPVLRPGVPVLAAGIVALVASWLIGRKP
ncbi:MAG: AzlC family ABC transporter permease [bacterium]|nr:AzlC family ABC transporter permease [bacterium]